MDYSFVSLEKLCLRLSLFQEDGNLVAILGNRCPIIVQFIEQTNENTNIVCAFQRM
jgi:hypothetical protein